MRIMLQNSLFFPRVIGGAELSTHLLGETLRAMGHEVDALATTGTVGSDGQVASRPTADGRGTVYEAPAHGLYDLLGPAGPPQPPNILVRGLHHLAAVHSPRWLSICRRVLGEVRPDVVHTNTIVGMTPVVWQAAGELGIPVLHTLRDYHLLCPRTTLQRSDGSECLAPPLPCRILAGLKVRRTRGVRGVTAPSRWVLDRHLDAGAFPDACAEVVPNACESIPDSIPDRAGRSRVRGLFLGQLSEHKGVGLLLEALPHLLDDPACATLDFTFAGTGPLADRVADLARSRPGRVEYAGMVEGAEKDRLLAAGDFITVPSLWHDNFPRTLLDACAWGMPVIGARRGGIPEVIRDGIEGMIIEPEPRALAAAVGEFVQSFDQRLARGRAARLRAFDFTLKKQASAFLGLYRDLAGTVREGAGS